MRTTCSMIVAGAADLDEGKENSPVPAAAAESGLFGAMAGICSPKTPEGMVNASRIQKKVAPGKGGALAASRSRLGQVIQLQTVPAAVGSRTSSAQVNTVHNGPEAMKTSPGTVIRTTGLDGTPPARHPSDKGLPRAPVEGPPRGLQSSTVPRPTPVHRPGAVPGTRTFVRVRARRTLNLGADSDCSSLQTSSDSGVLPPLGCSRSAEDLRLSTDRLFRSSSGQLMCLARSADWSQGAALQRKRSDRGGVEIPVSRKSFKRDETSQSWDAAAACLASMHLQDMSNEGEGQIPE